jgi:transcriptional regulator with XRE-family HTH domain
MELGARPRQIRKAAGLTGKAVAEATGQPITRVSRIENGTQPPTSGRSATGAPRAALRFSTPGSAAPSATLLNSLIGGVRDLVEVSES